MAEDQGQTRSRSEGFEAIMAQFFNPEAAGAEEGENPGEGGFGDVLADLRERPGDADLHSALAERFAGLQQAAPGGLDTGGGGIFDALEQLFRQMARHDIRIHRVMYRDLEETLQALGALSRGEQLATNLSELEERLRRHLIGEEGEAVAEAGGGDEGETPEGLEGEATEPLEVSEDQEPASAPAEAEGGPEGPEADLEALNRDPADELALDRLGRTLDDWSEELSGAAETVALRMGDVLGAYAEGEVAWGSAVADGLADGLRAIREEGPDPEEVAGRLADLAGKGSMTIGGGGGGESPQEVLGNVEQLLETPGDSLVLEDLGSELDNLSEEETGQRETLALRMGDVLAAYAEGELDWSEDVGQRLRGAAEALAQGGDPAPLIAGLQALMDHSGEGASAMAESNQAEQGGAGELESAFQELTASPSDPDLLAKARAAAEANAAAYRPEGGPFADLSSRLEVIFQGLADYVIRLHKVMVEDLKAALGAFQGDEQAAKDSFERLERHLPEESGADEEAGTEADAGGEAEDAGEAESVPEPEPAPAPAQEGGQEAASSGGSGSDQGGGPEIEVPEGVETLPEDADPDLVGAFIEEAREGLESLDQDFMALEDNPKDGDRLHSAFRTIHTIKGNAGFLGLGRLKGFAHAMESVMDRVRGFEIDLNQEMMDDFLAGTDILKQVVNRVAEGYGDNVAVEQLAERFAYYLRPDYSGEAPTTPKPGRGGEEEAAPAAGGEESSSDGGAASGGEQAAADGGQQETPAKADSGGGQGESGGAREQQTLRVPLDRLDRLFNLVGELVLTRNQTRELARRVASALDDERLAEDLSEEAHRLDLVTSDLQSAVMQTRMHSLSSTFNKFKRVVRDLARKTNKKVNLNITGEQTELDRNVIESIQDPLVHLIRNSMDHGIEEPDTRKANGKDPTGELDLRAYYEENYVVIEVADDGAGLSSDKLRRKAVEKGVVDDNEAQQMSDREAQQLIFAAGFSSVDQVSDISGRGVGMDVVRSNVEELKGSIELDSTPDVGTTVQVRLPLTLSIQQTLIVQIGPEHFAIPLEAVKETLDFDFEQVTTVRGQRVYQREDEILPILQMTEQFGMSRVHDQDASYLVVLEQGVQRAGILVDRIVGKEEAVMKALDSLKGIHEPDFFAGASVRGDGRISLVVDVARLFSRVATMRGHAKGRATEEASGPETYPYLLLDGGTNELYALPREEVHHIELVNVDEVQWMNGQEYLKRENRAAPIVRLATVTGETFNHPGKETYIVFLDDGHGDWGEGILTNHLHGIQYLQPTQKREVQVTQGISGAALWGSQVVGILDKESVQASTEKRVPNDLAAGA